MRLLKCVVVITALGLLAVTCGKQPEQQPSVQGGVPGKVEPDVKSKILFISDRDGNHEIYVMNTDGTNQSNLTNSYPANDWDPSWSPDGKKIAFTSNRNGHRQIYVMNSNGTNQTNLSNGPALDWYPTWSPDGAKIAFASGGHGDDQIHVMNSDGTNRIPLTRDGGDEPRWSPDGKKIAFLRWCGPKLGGSLEIYTMDADGTNERRLTRNQLQDCDPSWSPDGRKVAFQSEWGGDQGIHVINSDGTNQTRLTKGPSDWSPSWSPDGTRIAFQRTIYTSLLGSRYPTSRAWPCALGVTRQNQIYVMNADGTNQTRLTNNTWEDFQPSWSPF